MHKTFLRFYAMLTSRQIAEAVYTATGVKRCPAAARQWAAALRRKGGKLPTWLEPQLVAVLRALQAEVDRGRKD